jgi:DNA-binding NarL/FixJ family response regulator
MPSTDLEQAVRSAAVMRRIIVDHVRTGLDHPNPAAVRQARALATEMDVAGLGIDHEIRPLQQHLSPELAGELVVLAQLARGQDVPEIAKKTGLSVREVRLLLQAALTRYGALNPTHAVALAIAAGDLPPDIALQE